MIKKYFRDLFSRFNKKSIVSKILIPLFICIYLFIFIISLVPCNYIILTPGSLTNTIASVSIDNTNSRGQICTVGIFEYVRPSVLQYWVSKNKKEIIIEEYVKGEDLSEEQSLQFGTVSKTVSINNALILAYEKAKEVDSNINIVKKYEGVIVSVVLDSIETDLKSDDIITKVNAESFNDYNEFRDLITKYKNDKYITLSVKRKNNKKEYFDLSITCNYKHEDEKTYLPFSAYDYYSVDGKNSNPKFTVTDAYNSIGSSGGAMLALSIYNGLLEKDVTKVNIDGKEVNLLITGTGTIDINGTVGDISGVEQKIFTAYNSGANVFFVNSEDYEACVSAFNKYQFDENAMRIIKVSTFDQILDALENWGE